MSSQVEIHGIEMRQVMPVNKKHTPEEIAGTKARATLITNRVTEAVFNDNKGNDLLMGIANSIRRPFGFPLISRVTNTAVHRSSSYYSFLGHKMYADLTSDAEKVMDEDEGTIGNVTITTEVQEREQESFAVRGTISQANAMQKNFAEGASYTNAPDVMGISILGNRLVRNSGNCGKFAKC